MPGYAKNPTTMKQIARIKAKLQQLHEKYGKPVPNVTVGYKAPYALYVHENLEIHHPIHGTRNCGGQAKFLTQPARENRPKYASTIVRSVMRGTSLVMGMLAAGAQLLSDSKKLVPVLTGELRDSGFVNVGNGIDVVGEGVGVHVTRAGK